MYTVYAGISRDDIGHSFSKTSEQPQHQQQQQADRIERNSKGLQD